MKKSAEFEAAFAEVKKIRRIRFFKAGFAKASAESALRLLRLMLAFKFELPKNLNTEPIQLPLTWFLLTGSLPAMKSLSSPAAPSAATGSRIHSRFGAMSAVLLLLLLIPLLRCCFSGVLSNVYQDGPRTFPTSALSPPTTSPTRSSFGVASRSKVSDKFSTRDHDRGAARRIRLTAARDMEMSDEHLEQLTRKKCKDGTPSRTRRRWSNLNLNPGSSP